MQIGFLLFLVLLLAGAYGLARYRAARERRRINQRRAHLEKHAEVERRARQAF